MTTVATNQPPEPAHQTVKQEVFVGSHVCQQETFESSIVWIVLENQVQIHQILHLSAALGRSTLDVCFLHLHQPAQIV